MPNRSIILLQNAKTFLDRDTYEKVTDFDCSVKEKMTTKEQAVFARDMLINLEKNCDEKTVRKIMQSCGHNCISKALIEKLKKEYSESDDIEKLIGFMNRSGIGGKGSYIKDRKIICIYDKCYCGTARSLRDMLSSYCYCSEGWFGKLFSEVLGKEVEVRKRKTILDGEKECEFEITVHQQ